MTTSEGPKLDAGKPKERALVPRDAASVVLIDRSAGEPRLLIGRRRADLAFLAGKYVFPGGRVDQADKTRAAAQELSDETIARLRDGMRGRPSLARARALGVAAARELYEESGYSLGAPSSPDEADLSALTYFARAITPPGRTRRYDTRFFVADARHAVQGSYQGDGELLDLAWLPLVGIERLDLPGITRMMLSDIAPFLQANILTPPVSIPFYHFRAGMFRRDLV